MLHRTWVLRTRCRIYAAAAAALALVLAALVLTQRGGDDSRQTLVLQDATPAPTTTEQPTEPASPEPTAAPATTARAVALPSASRTSTPAIPFSEPLAADNLLLKDGWVDATFGNGRRLTLGYGSAGDLSYNCSDRADYQAGRVWWWPDETQLGESLQTMRSGAAAEKAYSACTTGQLDPPYAHDPVSSRRLDVGDEAMVITMTHPLITDIIAVSREGTTIVLVSWMQSGSVPSDAPAERMLSAAVAALVKQPVDEPVPAAAPRPLPDVAGFLSTPDVRHLWSGDYRGNDDTLTCGPSQTDAESAPPRPQLRLRQPAVSRDWFSASTEPEFGWAFTRARSIDTKTATSDFRTCRMQQPHVTDLPGVGDEAFCLPVDDPNLGAQCYAREDDTFYVWSDQQYSPFAEMARLLRLAIARDSGR